MSSKLTRAIHIWNHIHHNSASHILINLFTSITLLLINNSFFFLSLLVFSDWRTNLLINYSVAIIWTVGKKGMRKTASSYKFVRELITSRPSTMIQCWKSDKFGLNKNERNFRHGNGVIWSICIQELVLTMNKYENVVRHFDWCACTQSRDEINKCRIGNLCCFLLDTCTFKKLMFEGKTSKKRISWGKYIRFYQMRNSNKLISVECV